MTGAQVKSGKAPQAGSVELVVKPARNANTGVYEVSVKGAKSGSERTTQVLTSPRAFALEK